MSNYKSKIKTKEIIENAAEKDAGEKDNEIKNKKNCHILSKKKN